MKAYIIGGDKTFVNFLPEVEITDKLKDAKIVIFGDGPIVSPSLYKEKKAVGVDLKCDINRDRSDKSVYTKLKPDQIAVGIGRGACFLAVMNGASLVQNAIKKNRDSSYMVEFKYGDTTYIFPVLSDWVQSINLEQCENFEFLGKSKESLDYVAEPEVKRFMKYNGDPELVLFRNKKQPVSICIQFHPEWMPEAYSSKLLKELIYECANS